MYKLPTGAILVDTASYHKMVEDGLLHKLRAEKLEQRVRELVEECDSLRQRLAAPEDKEKSRSQ